MPRSNPLRTMGREDQLAQRIEELRLGHRPPLTYEALAKRMTERGCSIQPSAIQRIERATPRRKVSVDELVAFAEVFDVTLEDLVGLPKRGLKEQAEAGLRLYRWALSVKAEADRRVVARQAEAREAGEALEARLQGLQLVLGLLERVDFDPAVRPNYTESQLMDLVFLREEIKNELDLGEIGWDRGDEGVERRG